MNYKEVVDKLIGPVDPVAETNEDSKRLENLKEMCDLASHLMRRIYGVANQLNRHEHSVHRAAAYADNWMKENITAR